MEGKQPRDRADVVLELAKTVTRLEAARRVDLLDELFALDARAG
jgi:hypothetical protein